MCTCLLLPSQILKTSYRFVNSSLCWVPDAHPLFALPVCAGFSPSLPDRFRTCLVVLSRSPACRYADPETVVRKPDVCCFFASRIQSSRTTSPFFLPLPVCLCLYHMYVVSSLFLLTIVARWGLHLLLFLPLILLLFHNSFRALPLSCYLCLPLVLLAALVLSLFYHTSQKITLKCIGCLQCEAGAQLSSSQVVARHHPSHVGTVA